MSLESEITERLNRDDRNIKVRFPCDHGVWFRHMIRPVKVGRPVWCDGGDTRWLRPVHPSRVAILSDDDDDRFEVYVERKEPQQLSR